MANYGFLFIGILIFIYFFSLFNYIVYLIGDNKSKGYISSLFVETIIQGIFFVFGMFINITSMPMGYGKTILYYITTLFLINIIINSIILYDLLNNKVFINHIAHFKLLVYLSPLMWGFYFVVLGTSSAFAGFLYGAVREVIRV